jgi:hypothetical protein
VDFFNLQKHPSLEDLVKEMTKNKDADTKAIVELAAYKAYHLKKDDVAEPVSVS